MNDDARVASHPPEFGKTMFLSTKHSQLLARCCYLIKLRPLSIDNIDRLRYSSQCTYLMDDRATEQMLDEETVSF